MQKEQRLRKCTADQGCQDQILKNGKITKVIPNVAKRTFRTLEDIKMSPNFAKKQAKNATLFHANIFKKRLNGNPAADSTTALSTFCKCDVVLS